MSAYVPEYVYGLLEGSYLEYDGPRYGLIPWPAHMTPASGPTATRSESSGIELTKKGKSYVAAALAEAGGVFFLTIDRRDRAAIVTTIERLINMLDDMEGDPDLEPDADGEPSLGWPDARGLSQLGFVELRGPPNDDREADCEGEGAQCDDEGAIDADLEANGDEVDFDGGEDDPPGIIWGGGSDDSGRAPA